MFLRIALIIGLLVFSGELLAKDVGGKTVPISGIFSGYILGFNQNPDDMAGRCDPPEGKYAWSVTSFAGSGTMSHLGEVYWQADHCSYGIEGFGPDGTYGEGEIEYIADNGDVLLGTYTNGMSTGSPPVVGIMHHSTFVDGGTGRFTYASGGVIEMGAVDFRDMSMTVQMTGVGSLDMTSRFRAIASDWPLSSAPTPG